MPHRDVKIVIDLPSVEAGLPYDTVEEQLSHFHDGDRFEIVEHGSWRRRTRVSLWEIERLTDRTNTARLLGVGAGIGTGSARAHMA